MICPSRRVPHQRGTGENMPMWAAGWLGVFSMDATPFLPSLSPDIAARCAGEKPFHCGGVSIVFLPLSRVLIPDLVCVLPTFCLSHQCCHHVLRR